MDTAIDLYLKRGKQLLQEKNTNSEEFADLVRAIRRESINLTPSQREEVLERFFELWDNELTN